MKEFEVISKLRKDGAAEFDRTIGRIMQSNPMFVQQRECMQETFVASYIEAKLALAIRLFNIDYKDLGG